MFNHPWFPLRMVSIGCPRRSSIAIASPHRFRPKTMTVRQRHNSLLTSINTNPQHPFSIHFFLCFFGVCSHPSIFPSIFHGSLYFTYHPLPLPVPYLIGLPQLQMRLSQLRTQGLLQGAATTGNLCLSST